MLDTIARLKVYDEVEVTFKNGDVVYGKFSYRRLKAPDFTEPEAISILLSNRLNNPFYYGTVFSIDSIANVELVKEYVNVS